MTTSVTTPTDQSLSWMGGLTQTIAQSMETQVIFGGEATQASMKLAQESANNSNEAGAEAVKAANDQKWISLVTTIVMVISIIALPVGGLISFAADAGMSAAADAGTQMAKQAVLEGLNTAKEGVTAGCIAVGSGTTAGMQFKVAGMQKNIAMCNATSKAEEQVGTNLGQQLKQSSDSAAALAGSLSQMIQGTGQAQNVNR